MTIPGDEPTEDEQVNTLNPLTQDECWDLLGDDVVGRIGFDVGHGIRIHPVNYEVEDRTILVRTAHGTELGTCAELFGGGAIVGLQVDALDRERRQGWSVLVNGRVSVLLPGEVQRLRDERGEAREGLPWVDGDRALWLRLTPVEITGRSLGPAGQRPTGHSSRSDLRR
jgi:hypothetical protein